MHDAALRRILVPIAHNPALRPSMIHEDIRNLLEAPPTGDRAPTLDHIEHTLTSGYARALALEAERWRLERKITDVAARLVEQVSDEDATELSKLSQRLADADGDLTRLRALLASLRTRADEVRAA